MLAYLIDMEILLSVAIEIFFPIVVILSELEMKINFPLFNIFHLTMSWIYFSVLDSSSWKTSVGKKSLGLKVVHKNGDRISFCRDTGRHFATIISILIILIGYMMAGWKKRKEGLHDMYIAGILIIQDCNIKILKLGNSVVC